jgi:hypothetical protein
LIGRTCVRVGRQFKCAWACACANVYLKILNNKPTLRMDAAFHSCIHAALGNQRECCTSATDGLVWMR